MADQQHVAPARDEVQRVVSGGQHVAVLRLEAEMLAGQQRGIPGPYLGAGEAEVDLVTEAMNRPTGGVGLGPALVAQPARRVACTLVRLGISVSQQIDHLPQS